MVYNNNKRKILYRNSYKNIYSFDYINENKIERIDFVKIDTEGYEYEILKGLNNKFGIVNFIMFEHHYHDMLIKKNYTFSKIHSLLEKNNFRQFYKAKMPFRKTFEYIYRNNLSLINNEKKLLKATILIINYNNSNLVERCIKSVHNQTYKNKEIIFIDDLSSDGSYKKAKKFKFLKVFKTKQKTKHGSINQINACKLGISKSRGDIIFFLDSDDFFKK